MHLTSYTDYSLRILIFLGAKNDGDLSNIKEISETFNISKNHLSKIVHQLGKLGLIDTIRGRNGGIKLGRPTEEINIGWVVRQTEEDLNMAECFQQDMNQCIISSACRLKHVLNEALSAYLKVLDSYTLADILINKDVLKSFFK